MMNGLKQNVHGIINLDSYFAGGGMLDCVTDEIFATFITGQIPDIHGFKMPIDLKATLKGTIPTIFNLTDSVSVDVPSWNRHPQHNKFQRRVGWYLGRETHRVATGIEYDEYWGKVENEKNTLIPNLYSYIEHSKFDRINKALDEDKSLTMIYFWFTDIQGHIQKYPPKSMYNMAEILLNYIKSKAGEDALIIVMSDHGMIEGHHRTEGFWSLSKPLLTQGEDISMTNWYSKIEEWLKI